MSKNEWKKYNNSGLNLVFCMIFLSLFIWSKIVNEWRNTKYEPNNWRKMDESFYLQWREQAAELPKHRKPWCFSVGVKVYSSVN